MNTIDHKLKDGVILTAFEKDHIGNSIGATKYYYEGGMLDYIKANVPRGAMIDVGANIGNHSIYLAKYCATNVIAFEPFPSTFAVLVKNIQQNKFMNITALPVGLSDESKETSMSLSSEGNVGMAKIDEAGSIYTRVDVLDTMLETREPITLIKIDCEGHEEKALKGMLETIKKHKPALFIECQTPDEFTVVNSILSPLGYRSVYKFNATPTYYFKFGGLLADYEI